VAFNKYVFGKPYITNITIKSFQKDKDLNDALKNKKIESVHSISPKTLSDLEIKPDEIILSPLPRIFGLFFNQNVATVFTNKEVREALDIATDKKAIVDNILGGYGQIIDGPVPPNNIIEPSYTNLTESERIEKAKNLLIKNGWKENSSGIFEKKDKSGSATLSFSISTGDAPELKETAYLLQNQWQKIGAEVEVKIFGIGDLNQNIIKPRKYDSLLFGEIVGRDLDLYPFWHSSQRNNPGLNIALYTNIRADKLLENIRNTTDLEQQKKYLESFNKEIKNDMPAVFTYSPHFIYIMPKKIHNVNLGILTNPSERFSNVSKWYIETNHVWGIFVK
jgi:peptide/nickel transport system substrate-binding protein